MKIRIDFRAVKTCGEIAAGSDAPKSGAAENPWTFPLWKIMRRKNPSHFPLRNGSGWLAAPFFAPENDASGADALFYAPENGADFLPRRFSERKTMRISRRAFFRSVF